MAALQRLFRVSFTILILIFNVIKGFASDSKPWDGPTFKGNPTAIIKEANAIDTGKGYDALVLLDERKFLIEASGRSVQTIHMVYRVDTADGVRIWGATGVRWEPWHQKQPVIRARVITADGVEHVLDPKTLSDAPERESTPEIYSDTRVYHGPLPAVAVGSVVELESICEDTAPSIPGGTLQRVYFQRRVPSHQIRLILQRPTVVPLNYEVRLLPDAKVTQKKTGNMIETSIDNGFLEAYESIEWDLPGDAAVGPQIEFSTVPSWKDVAAAYARMAEPQIQPDSVKNLVAAILSPADSREDKIRKLTAKLHREIRYTGIEFGESQLVPQPAAEVFKRKYGDCKDKSATLVAMLRAADVPAFMALLNATEGQDVSPSLAGGNLFNHAIVYIPGKPDIWIDATDEFSAPGSLAPPDQGRKALIISPDSAELMPTPVSKAEENLLVETREFYLAEFGPTRIVETSEAHGSMDSIYRSYYGNGIDNKKIQKEMEAYVKNAYFSDNLEKFDAGDGRDLSKPFVMRIEVSKAKRGYTSLKDARMAIPTYGIVDRMPDYFKMSDAQLEKTKRKSSSKEPERTLDYELPYAFVTEWRYRIVPPIGFKVRALPENRVREMGPARLSQQFIEDPDGVVKAVFVFSSGKSRYTVAEAEAVRKGIRELREANATIISFDQQGYALLSAGKTKEAIAAFESIVRQHPSEALHRVQLAQGLLEVGLAEDARSEAREAIRMEPQSPLAHSTLGWILQHDLIGRRFKKGFDLEGAKAEYRKALELDPEDMDVRIDFTILLEHNIEGERYAFGSDLKGAIEQYRDLQNRKSDWEYLDNNLLFALFYDGQYKEAEVLASKLAPDNTRTSLAIAARAAYEGSESALKKSLEMTADEKSRMEALASAAGHLLMVRHYTPAAELLDKIHTGKSSLELIQAIAKSKRYEELTTSEKDAAEYLRKMLILVMGPEKADRNALDMFVKSPKPDKKDGKAIKEDEEYEALCVLGRILRNMTGTDLPFEARGDVFLSNMHLETEGNENSGFRIKVRGLGIENLNFYVIKEQERYRILDYRGTSPAGRAVFSCLQKGDLDGARRWLDWMREEKSIDGGDDPFAGPVFPRLWRKGQNADKKTMQQVAAAMVTDRPDLAANIPMLVAAQKQARDESARNAWTLALGNSYLTLERWNDARAAAGQLLKASKDSATAFAMYVLACTQLKDWNAITVAAKERLALFSKDQDAIEILSDVADRQGKLEESLNILRTAIKDNSNPSKGLMNNYAWTGLFMDKLPEDAVEYAQRAVRVTESKDFGIVHTLSAVYAEVGRVGEARQLLLAGMDDAGMTEPDSAIWYVFGRIAEQYGRLDAAMKAYHRIDDEQEGMLRANSTYNLAQRRIAKISPR